LAEKRKKETKEKACIEVKHAKKEQVEQEERSSDRIQKSPSSQMEYEEQLEQGSRDLESTPFYINRHRE